VCVCGRGCHAATPRSWSCQLSHTLVRGAAYSVKPGASWGVEEAGTEEDHRTVSFVYLY